MFRALSLALLIVVAEYVARRFVAYWLPILGAARVNDMLSSTVFYGLLLVITTPTARLHLSISQETLREIAAERRKQAAWVWVGIFLASARLSLIDQWLWGSVQLPEWSAPPNPEVLFPQAGPALAVISLLLVNGLFVPFAEERLWRGLIQPRLVGAMGFSPGLLVTALLFSLKHAIVDASLGRLLALTVAGLVLGYVASRGSWKHSAFTHIVGNTVGTVVGLLVTGGDL